MTSNEDLERSALAEYQQLRDLELEMSALLNAIGRTDVHIR
jgi:hypothetical protein